VLALKVVPDRFAPGQVRVEEVCPVELFSLQGCTGPSLVYLSLGHRREWTGSGLQPSRPFAYKPYKEAAWAVEPLSNVTTTTINANRLISFPLQVSGQKGRRWTTEYHPPVRSVLNTGENQELLT
jgi:hypothetical protein